MNILVVFRWLVKQDWCEAILEQMGKESSVEKGCLTCRTVLGLRSKFRLEHWKVKHRERSTVR